MWLVFGELCFVDAHTWIDMQCKDSEKFFATHWYRDRTFMDLSSVHGNKLQMRFSHHYKSVDVRVQIKKMFPFFSYFEEKVPIFSYFSAFSFLFSYFLQVIWHLTPWNMKNAKLWNLKLHEGWNDLYFVVNILLKTTKLSFFCPVPKEDDGTVASWLRSHL